MLINKKQDFDLDTPASNGGEGNYTLNLSASLGLRLRQHCLFWSPFKTIFEKRVNKTEGYCHQYRITSRLSWTHPFVGSIDFHVSDRRCWSTDKQTLHNFLSGTRDCRLQKVECEATDVTLSKFFHQMIHNWIKQF